MNYLENQQHILIRASFAETSPLLTDVQCGLDFLLQWIRVNNMTVIDSPLMHKFNAQRDNAQEEGGYSGVALLCESHVSIHTYPETQHIYADIYSCMGLDKETNLQFLNQYNPTNLDFNFIKR